MCFCLTLTAFLAGMGLGLAAINPDMGTGMDLVSTGPDPGAGTTIKPPGVLGRVKNAGLDVNDDTERLELSNEETGIPGGYEHDSLAAQGTRMLEMNGDLESHGFLFEEGGEFKETALGMQLAGAAAGGWLASYTMNHPAVTESGLILAPKTRHGILQDHTFRWGIS